MNKKYVFILISLLLMCSCVRKDKPELTPWGTPLEGEKNDSATIVDNIMEAGEMIVLTVSGPDTYYDYHGHGMGVQYMMCENFALDMGVTLRVEVCKDTLDMVDKLKKGYGDVIAVQIPVKSGYAKGLVACGAVDKKNDKGWLVAEENKELADMLDKWYKTDMPQKMREREDYIFSAASINRHEYAPYINKGRGIMSNYDSYFRHYAPTAGVDWHLLAAQCYQESCFDPMARSWAGACGLMQIMPSTARQYGLAQGDMFNPERNIATGAKIMGSMMRSFSDITNMNERINFALAAYNAGPGHIRDAMALARKNGETPHSWAVVSQYVLKLSLPEYYKDPVVRHGYMRGKETVGYVSAIRNRY